MKTVAVVTCMLLWLIPATSQAIEQTLPPAQETIAQQLFHELKCMVCAGQSLAESDATLAIDMRRMIRTKIAQGATPEAITDFLVERYGIEILMSPPLDNTTSLLWAGPFLLMVLGFVIAKKVFARSHPESSS